LSVKKLYLASPWFNENQKKTMDKIYNILLFEKFDVFAPFYNGLVVNKNNDSLETRKKAFDINVCSIDDCSLVVAVIDDWDSGTMFEIGYAYKSGIPVLGYSDVNGRGLNLMLQMAVWGFANGDEELKNQLSRFKNGVESNNYYSFINGDVV